MADVKPYELMKLRLLNASHQGIAYFGHLMGYRLVHDAVDDERMADFLLAYMRTEAIPTLLPVPGVELGEYTETLIKRFRNPQVKDTIARLAAESSDRIPTWLVPVIKENLAADRPVRLSAAIVASWARYAEGVDEQGEPIVVVDRLAESLTAAARRATPRPAGLCPQPGAVRRPDRRFAFRRGLPQTRSTPCSSRARRRRWRRWRPADSAAPASVRPHYDRSIM